MITSPYGVVAGVATAAVAVAMMRLFVNDIRMEEPRRGPPDVSLLPVRGRWSRYLLAALVVLLLSPFVFGVLLVAVYVLWFLVQVLTSQR